MPNTIGAKVQSLGYQLPDAPAPAANYVPTVRTGNLLFISGQISQQDGKPVYLGRLGEQISVEEGKQAAALCALGILAQVSAAVGGDIDKVSRVVRLGVFVASTPQFDQQSQVGNGASDLIAAVFGERGRHARSAVGVASLPRGVAVEVEAVVELAD